MGVDGPMGFLPQVCLFILASLPGQSYLASDNGRERKGEKGDGGGGGGGIQRKQKQKQAKYLDK